MFHVLVTEHFAQSWSRCTDSQPAGDFNSSTQWQAAITFRQACGYLCSFHQMSSDGSTHPTQAYYSFIDPERMKGWVGLVGWPVADGLSTIVVTHQLQVECRTGKVCRPETDVLPLCHATNRYTQTTNNRKNMRLPSKATALRRGFM